MTSLWKDLHAAVRAWRTTPILAAVIVLTLTLGIGATTAAFSLVYAVLLRPLPFPDVDRLVWIGTYNTREADGTTTADVTAMAPPGEYGSNRMAQFLDWQQRLPTFDRLAAWGGRGGDTFTVTGDGRPERIRGLEVTQQMLPLLGGEAAMGRLFAEGEDAPGAPPAVVLSHGYWVRRFAARPDIVGRNLILDTVPHTIVGVLSQEFSIGGTLLPGEPMDVFVPLLRDPRADEVGFFMTVLGRLRPGVTLEQAQQDVAARHAAQVAERDWMAIFAPDVVSLATPVTRDSRPVIVLLSAGIGCMLLLACSNLANLLLIRATGRRREMQVRAALGATTGRILRQTLLESLVLALAGAAGGVILASLLTSVVRTSAAWLNLPRIADVEIGVAPLLFAVALAAATTLVFGAMPLLHLRRRELVDSLRAHQTASPDRRAAAAQRLTLAAQVAFALMLSVSGGLMIRSFALLTRVDPGFRPDGAVAMRVDPAGRIPQPARQAFFDRLLETAASVPGVRSAALAINMPMDRNMAWDVAVPGQSFEPGTHVAFARLVTPGYFRTVGIRTIAGRDFDRRDQRNAPFVAAINETLARRVAAAGIEPLGSALDVSGNQRRIVAIVADVKHRALGTASGPEIYIPHSQAPTFFQAYDLIVRADDPMALVPAIREAIWSVERDQAIGTPVALQDLVDRSVRPQRLLTVVLGGFAAAALLLAALGVYGVAGYRVAQRRKELAIRAALGAPAWRIRSTVLRDAVLTVALGLAAGLPVALAGGALIRAFLFGVEPHDAATVAAACATLLAAAGLAAAVPARRASRVDPTAALRVD